jgi:hypothetical protein
MSALAEFHEGMPPRVVYRENGELLRLFRSAKTEFTTIVIEEITSYGMAVGRDVFMTVRWAARFEEAFDSNGGGVYYLPRRDVKLALCGDSRAKDANVRQAVIDRFGGMEKAVTGRRCEACAGKGWSGRGRPLCEPCGGAGWHIPRGPLYGVSGDMWSALAVGLAWQERQEGR